MMKMESIGPREWPQSRKLRKSQSGKQQGIKLSETKEATDYLRQSADGHTRYVADLGSVQIAAELGEGQLNTAKQPVLGAWIDFITAGPPATVAFPVTGSHVRLKRYKDGWRIMTVTPLKRSPGSPEKIVATAKPRQRRNNDQIIRDAKTTAEGIDTDLNFMSFGKVSSVEYYKEPAVKISRNTRKPKDELPPTVFDDREIGPREFAELFKNRAGRNIASQLVRQGPLRSEYVPLRRHNHVSNRDGDPQPHLHLAFPNVAPKPSPEARTLDAIRALYSAAEDAGSKVQSAVAHAHETAVSLGKSESAEQIAAISRQIEQLKAACREAVETLVVSGK